MPDSVASGTPYISTYATDIYSQYLKSLLAYKFLILGIYILTLYINMSKDVRILSHFFKPPGVLELNLCKSPL